MNEVSTVIGDAPISREAGVVERRRPILMTLWTLVSDPLASIPPEAFTQRMVVTRAFGATRAYITDPALIQATVARGADQLTKSAEMKRVLGAALGDGLLTADGASWRWQRQTMAPVFQHAKLTELLPVMIAAAEATRDRWLALPRGETIDIGHEMMLTTFAIIVDTMLSGSEGMDTETVERGIPDFLAATPWMFVMALLKAPRWLPYPGSRRAALSVRVMRGMMRARVGARRRAGAGGNDLLGKLLAAADPDSGRALSDEEVTDNILTFIAAGHETTALALSWAFALLSSHPDCLSRLVAEVEAVTGGGALLPEHVADLIYTRQVMDEAMRLYPPAPLIARSVEEDVEIAGEMLPKGSVVFVPIYAVHRHASLWTAPEQFDPDRFAPEAAKGRHRYAFMPFGAGPRVCIGNAFATMEAVAILAVLARACRLDLVDAALPRPQMHVTLRPRKPLTMRVVPR